MAKKKTKKQAKKQQPQQFLSPERYVREKVRGLEIGDCYMSDDLWETGLGHVVVTRKHNGGRISAAEFLVDTYCLGVRDCGYMLRMEDYELNHLLNRIDRTSGLQKISYEEAHNIVYGAVAFAEEGGISPHKDFALAEYFLEEDLDDIPLIEYDYGKDGKHFLVAKDNLELTTYLPTLQSHLGEANVGWTIDAEIDEDEEEEKANFLGENSIPFYQYNGYPYTYENHSYPDQLQLKHPEVLAIMQKKENVLSIPEKELEEILSIPREELAADLEHIILYSLGQANDGVGNLKTTSDEVRSAVTHSVMILREVGNSTTSLDAVLEVLRQSDAIFDYLVGDAQAQELLPTLILLGKDNLPKLEEFLYATGLLNGSKTYVMEAMVDIAYHNPEKREEVLSILKAFGERALKEKSQAKFTDYSLNGSLVYSLVDLQAQEFLPMIHTLYKDNLVSRMSCGPYRNVQEDIQNRSCHRPFDLSLRGCYDYMERAFGYNFEVYREDY